MENYLRDIQDIKKMMDRSSQFLSLSGMAGIMAGIYALAGALLANAVIERHAGEYIIIESYTFLRIAAIAAAVLVLSVATAFFLSAAKAKRNGETLWTSASRRLAINFLIPLVTGGIFAVLLIRDRHFGLIVPVTLIFYGLSCLNASKYTVRDVRYLGVTVILIGLLSTAYPGYGLEFWALGFGICHIVYGAMMYYKYDRK